MHRVTRRDFLLRATGLVAGVECARQAAQAPRVQAATSHAEATWPTAAVAQGTNDDSAEVLLKTALNGVGGITRFVKPGQSVCIKPNCTWDYPPHTASSTDPDLLTALILLVREAGAKRIIVLDHPTIASAAACLQASGIGAALGKLNVEKVFPDRTLAPASTYTMIDLPKGKAYQKMMVIKAAVEADVRINMAVAKTHVVLPVTLCLKHMMGFLENPPALHAYLEQGLIDINTESAMQASLHILEALRVRLKGMAAGVDTELTNPRLVKRFNQVVAGTDPVLIDAYACINYFGRQPKEVRYIKAAGDQKLGELDVKKAAAEGRLRIFKAGEAIATPTLLATATPVRTAGPATTEAGRVTPSATPTASPTPLPPTNTPLATATFDPASAATPLPRAAAEAAAGGTPPAQVVSPNSALNCALLPAALVVAGAGLVAGRRWRSPESPPQAGGPAGDQTAHPPEGQP